MKKELILEEWAVLRDWLPQDLEASAKENGFIRRSSGRVNAEIWLRLILMHVVGGLSLKQTMLRASELGWAELSAVALFKRLRVAQPWLSKLCAEQLAYQQSRLDEDTPWPKELQVRLIDATDVQEPGSTGTAWRVHYSLRMPHMVCDHFEITDAKGGEKFGRFDFGKEELVVADRGYCHRPGLAHVLDSGAHGLVRWNPPCFPLERSCSASSSLLEWLKRLPARASRECPVWFRNDDRRYQLRLCAVRKSRLATERAQQKLLKAARERGYQVREDNLEYARYVMVLCSAPADMLPCHSALELYRGRWQVELAFKRLKSLLDAGHVPKESDDSARAWMQAKILSALLIERTLWTGEFLSPWGYVIGYRGASQSVDTLRGGSRLPERHSCSPVESSALA